MIVLHANDEQHAQLNGYRKNESELLFAIDGSGKYIVGLEVLDDSNFLEIHEQLNALERIEYTPINEEYGVQE
jgi:hypothetical protein